MVSDGAQCGRDKVVRKVGVSEGMQTRRARNKLKTHTFTVSAESAMASVVVEEETGGGGGRSLG